MVLEEKIRIILPTLFSGPRTEEDGLSLGEDQLLQLLFVGINEAAEGRPRTWLVVGPTLDDFKPGLGHDQHTPLVH